MRNVLIALCGALVAASCAIPDRERDLVERALAAMGGAGRLAAVRSVSFKGSAKFWEPEQSEVPGGEMRFANASTFEGVTDVAARATRIDWLREFAYPSPRTFRFSEIVTPQAGYVAGIDSNGRNDESRKSNPPGHSMSGLRLAAAQRELRRADLAGLLLAMRRDPRAVRPASDIGMHSAVAFGEFVVAFDPLTGLPTRVRTLDYDNIWGDVTFDYAYSDWRDVDGVKVPMGGRYELNGRRVAEFQLAEVRLNPPVDRSRLEIPAAALAGAAKPAVRNIPYQWVIRRQFIGVYLDSDHPGYDARASEGLRLEQVANGVHLVRGGSHNSLLVEMNDHLVVFDAPVDDAQSLWLVGQARARFPGKPIRFLVLTHHHMDHAGGLRGILAEGATLVVGKGAAAHYRRVLASPMTRNFDLKPRSFHMTPILEVPESHVMRDPGGRQAVVYVMDNPHAQGMLMGWIADVKLGFVTDLWSPGAPLPPKPTPALAAVVETVNRAGLDPERFAGGHGSSAPYEPLRRLFSR